jgi:integrase
MPQITAEDQMIRRYQRGSVRKKNGNYVLRYREDCFKPDGKAERPQKSFILGPVSAFRGKNEARKAADRFMQAVDQAASRPRASVTLGEFWVEHFKPNIVEKMKPNTRDMYQLLWKNHIEPAFERENMRDISGFEIDRLLSSKYKQGYASQTVLHLRSVLSKMFKTAIKWRWLVENPTKEIEAPPTRVKRQQRALSVEEVSLLFEHLENPARLIVIIGVMTGLRIGEILGLRIEDLDCDTLHVRRSWCRGHEGGTKNGKDRELPVPPFLGEALQVYCAQRPAAGWLFVGESGKPLSDRNLIQRHVYPVAQRLEIPHFSWHSLRHTFSTLGGNEGSIPTLVMKQLLGHSRLSTTDRYMHELAGPKREAVQKIENLILFPLKKASGE